MEQIDPGTALILSALGATLKDTASQASKDAYNWLKGLLKQRMEGRPDAERALAEYENAPDVNEAQLKEVLLRTRDYEDEEILDAARKV
ncbi:MAG: hypothetical protein M3437_07815 [Chloroflexota bacterium]|nr:hypothetical protein [Chloroflexota bacterium]MDQ5866223.1 hypothetical protein [Chloroflexota bacterium]